MECFVCFAYNFNSFLLWDVIRELKIRRRRVSATAAMTVENWGEAAVVRREK